MHMMASSVLTVLRFYMFFPVVLLFILTATTNPLATSSQPAACFPPDRAALLAFAAAFNSTRTPFFRTHWNPHLDCCSWPGVACGRPFLPSPLLTAQNSSRVVALSLVNKQLTAAQLPPALCRLSALSSLNLSANSLRGLIPSCIGHNLTSLHRLSLADNLLQSGIPPSFSRLTNLRALELQLNYLISSPSSNISPVANLSQLTYLDLSWNSFNGTLPFLNSPSLQHLDLSCNLFSGPIPPFNNTPRLQRLSLASNLLQSGIPPSFSCLTNLQALELQGNHLISSPSSNISPVANLSQLTYLDLSDNSFNGTLPMFLNSPSDLSQLTYLDLSENIFNGTLPMFLNSPSLQILDVSFNLFSGPIPPFNNTPRLQFLALSGNQWTGDLPSQLPQLIQSLHLQDSPSIAVQGSRIAQLFCDLISLRALAITGNLHVSATLDHQPPCEKPSVNLTLLDLSFNELRGPFPPWMGLFSNLQYLDLSGNNFSGSLIPPEWQSLSQLTFLYLSSTSPFHPDHHRLGDWLFRLPLSSLRLTSMGLTVQDLLPCKSRLSLLNHTLQSLDLSENNLSDGQALWHCFAHHNFTSLSELSLASNPLAFNLSRAQPLPKSGLQSLDLSDCQLFGTLTKEIFELRELRLQNNDLSGSLPSDLNLIDLGGLEWLDVSFNNLTGRFPSWLGKLPECYGIVLNNNHLDGEIIFTQLGPEPSFKNLEVLLLAHNHFSRAVFNHIATFRINILDLSFNRLEGDLQELLGDHSVLPPLFGLILGNNKLSGAIPASLGESSTNLLILDLSFNHLTGGIPESLKLLPGLQTGNLILFPMLVNFDLQSVKNVRFSGDKLLGYMDLSSNFLNGSITQGLGELVWLNDLNLSRNQLSGHIPSSLGNLRRLESLDLSHNHLQGSIPASLTQIYGLEVFNVSFNPQLSGQIPQGIQLETQDSYKGDWRLCGFPLPPCNADRPKVEPITRHDGVINNSIMPWQWIEEWVSIPGFCLSYFFGLGLTVWVLKRLKFYR